MRRLIVFFAVTAAISVSGQNRAKVNNSVEWFGTSSAVKLTPQFGIYLDGQYRFAQGLESMQHQFRIAPEFYVNNKLTISPFGFVYVWNYLYGNQPTTYKNNEQRFYQELKYKHSIKRFTLTHRFRTEERFIQTHTKADPQQTPPEPSIDNGYNENVQFRIRYRVWANYALNNEKLDPKTWYIPALVEGFMSWGKHNSYESKIDQLRFYTGIGYQINKAGNIQIGPFYQYLIKANGVQQENNLGWYCQLNYNFDFTKKKPEPAK